MHKTIPVDEAVGMVLPHDITEINKVDGFKGRAFRKGHIIQAEDIPRLKNLGKENIYILELGPDDIHENEAAGLLAAALTGPGTSVNGEPVEGKLNIIAATTGLLRVDTDALYQFNLLGEVMCATLHNNTLVEKGLQVGATRLIPLVGNRDLVDKACVIATAAGGIISVSKLPSLKAGLVITGNEVFHGRIKDAFEPVLRKKLTALGSEVIEVRFAPDDIQTIADEIKACLEAGAEIIITSGGMSVDPDDVTRQGIKKAGATDIVYGTPVLPGAMFLVGQIGKIPVLGLPACGMFHRTTVFDLILPRVMLGEKIGREELAMMGHGGLCRQCKTCRYPICDFGR
ncbi:MAG: molybdopterin-binding protein [Thermodesulfobacteriota bacterium]